MGFATGEREKKKPSGPSRPGGRHEKNVLKPKNESYSHIAKIGWWRVGVFTKCEKPSGIVATAEGEYQTYGT